MKLNKHIAFFVTLKHFLLIVFSSVFLLLSFLFENKFLSGVALILFIIVLVYVHQTRSHVKGEFELYMDKIYSDISSASKGSMFMLSIPMVLTDMDGSVLWKNSFFEEVFINKQSERSYIHEIIKHVDEKKDTKQEEFLEQEMFIEEKHYSIKGKVLKNFIGKDKNIFLFYFLDDTELYNLKQKYIDEKAIVGVLVIDNYDDMMKSMEDTKRPQMLAEIDAKIVQWFGFTGGILKKFERDKYVMFFERQFLKEMEERKFEILEWVKDINHGNKISVTLSIGLSTLKDSLNSNFHSALASLEIALGRGGDQVVVKSDENIKFYGGKAQEVEKRTKVKVRMIGNALIELIKQSGQIMVMGHANCDIDCLGASIGVHKIASSLGKVSYIVLGGSTPTIDPFIQRISLGDDYDGVFIDKSQAIDLISKKTLLIVVDTHRPTFTEAPEILKLTENIIVIDHHRRGVDFIEDAVLTYHEPYASSTCELITEILQYIENSFPSNNIDISPLEAELLYSGIVVDTKGFTFKAGVRTFEASAYLRDRGVDTIQVKRMLQNDLESYVNISNIVKDVQIIYDNMAFSVGYSEMKNAALIGAQAADQILSISGVEASFVLVNHNNNVFISARSLGKVNVQVILEKIGGGGHQTVAGAQFPNGTIEGSLEKLKEAIKNYIDENEGT
jgi:cyclic-di-AMP phosphodiesterase